MENERLLRLHSRVITNSFNHSINQSAESRFLSVVSKYRTDLVLTSFRLTVGALFANNFVLLPKTSIATSGKKKRHVRKCTARSS
jgi:hypothetical protein